MHNVYERWINVQMKNGWMDDEIKDEWIDKDEGWMDGWMMIMKDGWMNEW